MVKLEGVLRTKDTFVRFSGIDFLYRANRLDCTPLINVSFPFPFSSSLSISCILHPFVFGRVSAEQALGKEEVKCSTQELRLYLPQDFGSQRPHPHRT